MQYFQRTLKNSVSFSGVGLHTGRPISVEIRPASANTGILFQRTDLPGLPYIAATPDNVFDTSLATRIGLPDASVSTIEHLMAAFFGFGVDNAIVALDGEEIPILDGSAVPFLVLLNEAGVQDLSAPRRIFLVRQSIEVVDEKKPDRFIRIEPSRVPLLSYSIDFTPTSSAIGRQQISLDYTARSFCEQFAFARTFCLKEEVEAMQSRGLAKGGNLHNAIVVSSSQGVLNRFGLRHAQEFVRHKVLDCVGDLHLVGASLVGHVIANKAGHDLHVRLAKAIVQHQASFSVTSLATDKERSRLAAAFDFPRSLADVRGDFFGLVTG